MEMYSGNLERFSSRFALDAMQPVSDKYVFEEAKLLSRFGYLPEIDSDNPPPIDSIRQTLESQDLLTQSAAGRNVVMVPRDWVNPEETKSTPFHKGILEEGIVVRIDGIDINYRDTRKAMREMEARIRAQRIADSMTPEDLIPTSETLRRAPNY